MKTFKQFLEEDGAAAGVGSVPTNTVAGISGTGGQAGEPGVSPKRKKSPVLMTIKRNS